MRNRLLELLPLEAYLRIAAQIRPVHMAAKFVVAGGGERSNDAYFPEDCVISLQCATREGASVEFGMIGNEGALGLEVLLDGGRLPGRALVARAGRALKMPAQTLADLFRRCSPFRSGLLNFFAAFNAQVVQRSICHRVHTIEQQLCTWLLIMHDRSSGKILDLTHESVGGFLGGRREGVTIAIRRLRNDGLVRSGYRSFHVLDRQGLEARTCECYGEIRHAYARLSVLGSASPDRVKVPGAPLFVIPRSPIMLFVCLAIALVFALPVPAIAEDADAEMSKISGDPAAPRRHFRLVDPAKLPPQRAGEIYAIVRQALQGGYSRSGNAVAGSYQGWRRMNTAPYLSARHGNHYLNNYVNAIGAAAYGRYEKAGKLPAGSIIAKDSFSVTRSGEILLGGLFLMEKMPAGFNYVSGDWKYTFLQADGTLFGETNGTGSKRVEYCIGCHLAVEHQDHLWFLPRRFRVPARD